MFDCIASYSKSTFFLTQPQYPNNNELHSNSPRQPAVSPSIQRLQLPLTTDLFPITINISVLNRNLLSIIHLFLFRFSSSHVHMNEPFKPLPCRHHSKPNTGINLSVCSRKQ